MTDPKFMFETSGLRNLTESLCNFALTDRLF